MPASAGPTTCPLNSVCIDESVEGQAPSVTVNTPAVASAQVVPSPTLGSEGWVIILSTFGTIVSAGTPTGLELTEPSTGTVSDILRLVNAVATNFSYELSSDDENGTPGICFSCAVAVEDGTFQLEGGTHVGASTVSAGGGASHERNGPAHFMILLLGASRGIVENAENRPIRDGAKGPLPVVIIGQRADGAQLHDAQQRAQRDVDIERGARTQAYFFAKRGKK